MNGTLLCCVLAYLALPAAAHSELGPTGVPFADTSCPVQGSSMLQTKSPRMQPKTGVFESATLEEEASWEGGTGTQFYSGEKIIMHKDADVVDGGKGVRRAPNLKLTALTKHMPYGRPGGLFGETLFTRYLDGVSSAWPSWHAQTVRVRVTDDAGLPMAGVAVSWDTGEGISNGWIFPLASDRKTDSGGVAEAYWTAGSATEQRILVSIAGSNVTVTGRAGGQRVLAAAAYQTYEPPEVWDAWSVDLKVVKFPMQSYWALINMGPMYSGILPQGRVLFTTWWNNNDGQRRRTEIVDPQAADDGKFVNSTHQCHQTERGAEGDHASCVLFYNIREGHSYRLELHREFKSSPLSTDFTIFFSDLTKGIRWKVATMLYPGKHVDQKNSGGFFEMPYDDKYTCLDTPQQYGVFSNVRYRPVGSSSYTKIDRMGIGTGNGCANVWHELKDDGVHLSNGGTWVGWPPDDKEKEGVDQLWVDFVKGYSNHPTNCSDGLKNGAELGIDCGGPHCPKKCGKASTCSDGIHNGDEEYVDCGGGCEPCDRGLADQYRLVKGPRTLDQARQACSAIGGTLAVIPDRYHNRVAKKVCGESCWIGLSRSDTCRTPSCWRWANGAFLDETLFNHFGWPGTEDLYKGDFEGTQLLQKGLGEWRVVKRGGTVGATLCSTIPVVKRHAARVWRVSPEPHAWSVRATFFLDDDCKVPIGRDETIMKPSSVLDTRAWTRCAKEWQGCRCAGGYIRYGQGTDWSEAKRSSGTMKCRNDVFGDPAPGRAKHCECLLDKAGAHPTNSTPVVLDLVRGRPVGCVKFEGVVDQAAVKITVEYADSTGGPWSHAKKTCTLLKDGVTLCRPWLDSMADGDYRLQAYWDVGNCGPGADDQNVSLCGGFGPPHCPHSVQVDPSICPTKFARLVSVVGKGTYEQTEVFDGCGYYFRARYVCSFGPREDPRLLAYWDAGVCGLGTDDDQNAHWCGGIGPPRCKVRVAVEKDVCESGFAKLSSVKGKGSYEHPEVEFGCTYFYIARYHCD
mmetsp:Transcript_83780/g.260334  ORF Transcript_83780/g.260334 Transcript_83780/m.260334 type:complete len:1018 (-) Transcript_83780:134-3187(-)|eukprot:CAMPEP_0204584004 /NCGR_PEP_ID=MMETSP0661-20131031/46094_1 /ASSEMBLY_ACC=CAM_ASM_000606 /TAXON_ID=109239 /ORGANISM="Alexandrium margalefi, Strain AMGDE01CS-322" /LENGTH=1017 /DNA_ID=CAMNT_0051593409 /DNA_START=93 /DNA_END=3146 /DNA_ORIENTATION=-